MQFLIRTFFLSLILNCSERIYFKVSGEWNENAKKFLYGLRGIALIYSIMKKDYILRPHDK